MVFRMNASLSFGRSEKNKSIVLKRGCNLVLLEHDAEKQQLFFLSDVGVVLVQFWSIDALLREGYFVRQ